MGPQGVPVRRSIDFLQPAAALFRALLELLQSLVVVAKCVLDESDRDREIASRPLKVQQPFEHFLRFLDSTGADADQSTKTPGHVVVQG